MTIKRTSFASYCLKEKGIPIGCKCCVQGRKLVLFITGLCSRACFYCSLSNKRKGKDIIWANERECKKVHEAIEEVKASQARGAGITGGDPLLRLSRTIKYARALKQEFDKKFHIHIYLPTKLVTRNKLKKLSRYIDEVRFHPIFLTNNLKTIREELAKIKIASEFWKKENIGIELPLLPDKFIEITRIIRAASPFVGFVNLNELEISDTNFNYTTTNYKINKDGYTIRGSKEIGLKILKNLQETKTKLKSHLCTAKTKNLYQYKNRLRLHKILPFGFRTLEGSVRYFAIYSKNLNNLNKIARELKKFKQIYIDNSHNRIIISEKIVPKILTLKKYKIARIEELPTWDSTIISFEYL